MSWRSRPPWAVGRTYTRARARPGSLPVSTRCSKASTPLLISSRLAFKGAKWSLQITLFFRPPDRHNSSQNSYRSLQQLYLRQKSTKLAKKKHYLAIKEIKSGGFSCLVSIFLSTFFQPTAYSRPERRRSSRRSTCWRKPGPQPGTRRATSSPSRISCRPWGASRRFQTHRASKELVSIES